ncbi:MAG: hypothetical protein WKF57_03950 [Nakamurella sp.]
MAIVTMAMSGCAEGASEKSVTTDAGRVAEGFDAGSCPKGFDLLGWARSTYDFDTWQQSPGECQLFTLDKSGTNGMSFDIYLMKDQTLSALNRELANGPESGTIETYRDTKFILREGSSAILGSDGSGYLLAGGKSREGALVLSRAFIDRLQGG